MPLFSKGNKQTDYKVRLEHKLYLARENPEPVFDLSDCGLKAVPSGIYSLCKVFRKEILYLQDNHLTSLAGGGDMHDLALLQVLDLHANSLTRLPDEIQYLKNLKVLNVSDNQLILLPDAIGELQNLNMLNASNNNLKCIPHSVGRLQHLQHLDLQLNKMMTCLPANLCHARCLRELLLSAEGFVYPPEDVILQGVESVMKFLSAECGVDYVSPEDSPYGSSFPPGYSCCKDNFTEQESRFEAKIMQLEKLKEQKQKERLALEKIIEEQQKRELDLQTAMKRSKHKLLEDLVQQQIKLENEILRIQQDKEAERQHLMQKLQQVESAAESLVSQLLSASSSGRTSALLQQLLEQERKEEQQMLNICKEEYQSLQRRDILNAMQSLLEEECQRKEKLQEYEEGKWRTTRTLLSQELENDKQLEELLMSHGQAHSSLVNRLQKDEELQRAAVATLLERNDSRSWSLVQQVSMVETHLAALTTMEMKRRQLQLDEQVEDLCLKRIALSKLLMELLDQQSARRTQLLNTLHEVERRRWTSKDAEEREGGDFWLLQYQRLLNYRSVNLMKLEKSLDPALGHQLILAGVIHCLPLLAEWIIPELHLDEITDSNLLKVGINSSDTRKAILEAVAQYQENLNRRDLETFSQPTASLESDIDLLKSVGIAECVVCMEKQCEIIFVPCGHMCCCIPCSEQLHDCPMCRAKIEQKIKAVLP